MISAFLSHSSLDKEKYVRIVADKLKNKMNIIYDEYTFEEGNKTLEEIMKGLNKSQLFVFFISESALQSEWVNKEVITAKEKLDQNYLKQFFPIIIDKNITYLDKRIPDWIVNEYNLKYVSKPTIAAKRIEQKLLQISLEKHPQLLKKKNLCIGRNSLLDHFEERIDDFELVKPKCIIASGVMSIGRRTFLRYALEKTDIIDSFYTPNSIYLDSNDSIEDFILKINDFGFIDINNDLINLLSKDIDEKVQLAIKILKEFQTSKEIILILDNGCLINYERKISSWFKKIISSKELTNNPIICIASKYKVNNHQINNNDFYSIQVEELTLSERKRLFTRLLEIYDIDLSIDDFNYISSQFHGFPEQVLFCVDFIKRTNIQNVKDHIYEIRQFNDEKASMLIKHHMDDENTMSLIRLLAQFEIIGTEFIFSIVDRNTFTSILDKLITENLCEYFGYDGQFLRLNDSIRDYILRNRLEVNKEFSQRIKLHVQKFLEDDDKIEKDSTDYLFSIKEALRSGNIVDERLLVPSHFLRTMKELYYQNLYSRVIELADKVLEKEQFIDSYLANDLRYYLCLALARLKDKRVMNEVQKIRGDQHNFIIGYYYRLVGRYSDSIERLSQIVTSPYIMARAKREIVHNYIHTEGYSKALKYAKDNYIENKNNLHHIHLYFTCLIYSDKYFEHKDEIKRLVQELKEKSFEYNSDMGIRAEALYLARCENDEVKSFNKISDAISTYLDSYYPLLTKFEISFYFKNIQGMEEAITALENFKIKTFSQKTYIKQKAYLIALKDHDIVKAKQLINDELKNYPQEARDFILTKIESLNSL